MKAPFSHCIILNPVKVCSHQDCGNIRWQELILFSWLMHHQSGGILIVLCCFVLHIILLPRYQSQNRCSLWVLQEQEQRFSIGYFPVTSSSGKLLITWWMPVENNVTEVKNALTTKRCLFQMSYDVGISGALSTFRSRQLPRQSQIQESSSNYKYDTYQFHKTDHTSNGALVTTENKKVNTCKFRQVSFR